MEDGVAIGADVVKTCAKVGVTSLLFEAPHWTVLAPCELVGTRATDENESVPGVDVGTV